MGIGSRDMRFEWCDLRFVMWNFFCVVNAPFSCRALERLENGRPSAGNRPRHTLPVERTRRELMTTKLKVYFVNSGRLLVVLWIDISCCYFFVQKVGRRLISTVGLWVLETLGEGDRTILTLENSYYSYVYANAGGLHAGINFYVTFLAQKSNQKTWRKLTRTIGLWVLGVLGYGSRTIKIYT